MSNENTPVRVLHFSSSYRNPGCGVGKYQEEYLASMADSPEVENTFFEISPYETREMSPQELTKALDQLKRTLRDYDILHIQHEFALYWGFEFARIVEAAKSVGKKVVITVHLSPGNVKEISPVRLRGLGPRSLMAYLRQLRHHKLKWRQHIVPMQQADLLIVHNEVTVNALKGLGVQPERIKKLPHPVYPVSDPPVSHEASKRLNKQDGDVIIGMIGFLHRYKGTLAAVHALKFLPENYKLLLAGSVKGDSDDISFEDKVTDAIYNLGLKDRVYITGFVPGDDQLNALIRECDICVYPYDRVYYANASSGALNLALANSRAVIGYPTESIKEAAREVEGAIILCETFAYYELAREVQRIDIPKQMELAKKYAEKMAWPKAGKQLIGFYRELVTKD